MVCLNTWLPTGRIIEIWKRELLYVVKNVWCLSSPLLSGYRNTSGCPCDLDPNAGLLYGAHTACIFFWPCPMLLEEFSPLSLANDPARCFLNLFLFHHPTWCLVILLRLNCRITLLLPSLLFPLRETPKHYSISPSVINYLTSNGCFRTSSHLRPE